MYFHILSVTFLIIKNQFLNFLHIILMNIFISSISKDGLGLQAFPNQLFLKKIIKNLHNANSYELLEKYLVKNTYSEHLQLIPKKLDFHEICQNLEVPF